MNKVIIEITNCKHCKHCDHNGMLQNHPKWVCHHNDVSKRGKVDAKYWYDYPILAYVNRYSNQIDIPDWCPLLEK